MYTSQRQESRRKGYGIYTMSYNNKYEEDDEETKVFFFLYRQGWFRCQLEKKVKIHK